ncbi:hypothetical protein [Bradyrhizobium cenepequi]|uniref:hypothetical protein n=1 Tax=Bradyrhizobium cenepequi TaxID=2821403 RepID=UPI001CE397B9|nr:hypothetical protein [Bradyrhizobium cenepequi]MCA6112481.1 hypothetical protein [Bradyrhizobium cenepequi]
MLQKVLSRDVSEFKDFTAQERRELAGYLKDKTGDADTDKSRREILAELKKLEPKPKPKAESPAEASNNQRASLEKALRVVGSKVDQEALCKELSSPEHRKIRSELAARYPDRKLADTLKMFKD